MGAARIRAVPERAPRAIIYVRQSTYREESISLELQETACRDYCERHGYAVVAVEADPGISGRTWKRPAVQRAMLALENRDADIIVLWKWSRLSRSRKDWALALDRADVAGGRIESATEPIDTSRASGRFARGVMTEYAAFQSEQIGEQWEEVRQRRLRLGLPVSGRLPFGWRWVDGGGIEQHPEQAPYVVEMYRRYLTGDGGSEIARWLNGCRVPTPNGAGLWSHSRPFTVMDSPIHAGLIPYRGAEHPGAHVPLIDEYTRAAYLVERERRRAVGAKPRVYDHLLSGLMHCTCGTRMHGKGSVTGGHWYGGYICAQRTAEHPGRAYVSAKRIEPQVETWLLTFDLDVQPLSDGAVGDARRAVVHRELSALDAELTNLTRQLAKGIIPEGAYVATVSQIEAAAASLRSELAKLNAAQRAVPTADEVMALRAAWPSLGVPARNRATRQMIARIDVLDATRARLTTTWGESSLIDW